MKPFFKSCVRILLAVAVFVVFAAPVLLWFFQHRLIYFPRPYEAGELRALTRGLLTLEYRTAQGRQVAYFVPPKDRSDAGLPRVWLVFPGNAMLALDWFGFIAGTPNRSDGFLLIDYPGYGQCEGSPSPRTIGDSTREALATLRRQLGEPVRQAKVGVLALSIGTGAGLQFATEEPVDKVILVAPFVTLLEEARRVVGTPLCYTLRHRFDNRARLERLTARPEPPKVWIFHGTEDTVIPPDRGRRLHEAFPQMISLTPVEGGGHNSTLDLARTEIYRAMDE